MSIASSISGGGSGSGSGGIGGSTGATDNALLRADGAGGVTAQSTGITVSDANIMSGQRDLVLVRNDDDEVSSSLSGSVWTNGSAGGQITITLPAAPGSGEKYSFAVTAAHNLVVLAPGSQVIRVGASASTAGGTVTSSTVGSVLSLVYAANNLWIGVSSGTWNYA